MHLEKMMIIIIIKTTKQRFQGACDILQPKLTKLSISGGYYERLI